MRSEQQSPTPPLNAMPREFWVIAYIVLGVFLIIMVLILLGCWALLSGRVNIENGAALAAVAGLVGAIAGYAASSSQTVLSTIYGGSITNPPHSPRSITDASTTINANSVGAIDDSRQTDPQP